MTASAFIYANALYFAWKGHIDISTDALKMALLDSTYTPDPINDVHWSDISAHEISGTGYTAGGNALTTVSLTLTAANSWPVPYATSANYNYGDIVEPTNGFLYRCVQAGTTGGSAPSFPTIEGQTVTDGTVTWACLGDAGLVFTSDPVSWPSATFTTYSAVIYDAHTGTPSSEPLIAFLGFPVGQAPAASLFEVIPHPSNGWWTFSPPS